jgi:ABC-type Fe3+/spermidine/putrescine transport system ATPase subunit
MNQGRVEQIGHRAELLSRPKSQFVAEFLGVNLIGGCPTAEEDGLAIVDCSGVEFRAVREGSDPEPTGPDGAGPPAAHVTFNPGDVRLAREVPPDARGNIVRGRVTSITHLGGRARVTIEDSVAVVAEVPHEDLGRLDAHVGETLYAVIDPHAVRVYS